MPTYRYRALTDSGELVSGAIAAASAAEVEQRIEMLGFVLVERPAEERARSSSFGLASLNRPTFEEITRFTRDLALLLRAGVRINDALELLSSDTEFGRLRPVVNEVRAAVVAGESFADALSHHPTLFPVLYTTLVGIGESTGALDRLLEMLGDDRARAEQLRRRIGDAIRYPLFVLGAAGCVLVFFLMFVLPQFGAVLKDFGAKLDPVVSGFIGLSNFLNANSTAIAIALIAILCATWFLFRRAAFRAGVMSALSKAPLFRTVLMYHRTALFCRNLSILLGSGVHLTAALRILVEVMTAVGNGERWARAADRTRHGAKLSDALRDADVLPTMAVRMLRLGEETGQMPMLAGRVAEFYEAKLQRSLDRVVGVAGPAAIIIISIVVGGLIVSVMTALLSVSQIIS
jgi:general secretion pathway protein F